MLDTTQLSVVTASFSGEEALRRCLQSIVPQAPGAEVLVATAAAGDGVVRLEREFPTVRFVTAAPSTSVFRLRSLGLAAARGPIIVLTEDHCTANPGWLTALAAALSEGHDVVGGTVENGLPQPRDWALFLCEYLSLLPPLPDGPIHTLLGVNVAYRRAALDRCHDIWRDDFHESEVHDALQRSGYRLHCIARARVTSHLEMPLARALRHLYRGGRRFGYYRQSRSTPVRRGLWLAASVLVPLVLLYRMVRTIIQRQPALLQMLLRGLPHLLLLVSAWSAGEATGYLFGLRAPHGALTHEPANAAGGRTGA